jgi:hypothetical protein
MQTGDVAHTAINNVTHPNEHVSNNWNELNSRNLIQRAVNDRGEKVIRLYQLAWWVNGKVKHRLNAYQLD